MRVRVVWWTAAFLVGFIGLAPTHAQNVTNLLTNGGFESGAIGPYGIYGTATSEVVTKCVGATVPEDPIEGKYCLHVVVPAAGANNWDVGMTDGSHTFQKGKKYTFSCFIKVKSGTLQFRMKPERGADPWEAYNELVATATDKWQEFTTTTPVLTADVTPASPTFHFAFAPGDFWIDGVRLYEGDYVSPAFLKNYAAKEPGPDTGVTDVPRDVVLNWTAGPYAAKHNVFIGTTFDDVNTATVPIATLDGTAFDPEGLLGFDTTYYWRVDEVNAPPDSTVYKGKVWNFTTESYAYAIAGVTATASSASVNQGMTAAKTVDGSGLSAGGTHSSVDVDGWLSAATSKLPAWIQFQFDQAYMLLQMHVWNSNQKIEAFVGFGAKEVLIETSLDGTTWTILKTEEFARADGTDTYAGFTVDMGGVQARFVRLTIQTNWGGYIPQTGLGEVRFLYVPVAAREPSPANYAEGVAVDSGLLWREGRQAASHKVYFGPDKAAVANETVAASTTTERAFQPADMEFGQNYFWKVNEVNDAATTPVWVGNVWTFTTNEWAAIDDFENYTNESPYRVFQTWIDGWGFSADDNFPNGNQGNGTGALVGYDPSVGNIMETVIVHGTGQAMPVEYNNVNTPYYSEVEQIWESGQNWTGNGATELSVWFRGNPAAFVETASGITLSGGGADIYQGTAEFRFAYKKLTGDGSITVRVDSAQTVTDWTKSGVMVRENLDPLGMQVHMISAARQSLVEWMYRSASNSATTTQFNTAAGTNPLPVWLRVTRAGNVFTGECSTNGTTWTKITATDGSTSSTTILMPSTVYIGMVVCSQSAGELAVANFSQIKTTGNVTGQWQTADVGVAQPANSAEPLYVTVTDTAGKSKTIVHPDAAATSISDWTQWQIPLKDFTGVNTASVKKMVIGVGDRSNPKKGGGGMLYLDDIQYGRPITPVGLVAYYKLESDTLDSSGNGHDGVLAGNAAYPVAYVDGPTGYGKAMLFEGTQGHQYVDLGTFNPSEKTGKLSVALWAKWDGLSTAWQGLIGKRNNTWAAAGMMWQIEANQTTGALRFQREGTTDITLSNAPTVGQWVHIAVTFDGAIAKGYINGVKTVEAAFTFGSNREAPIQFGADTLGGGNSYNGTLDEIRLYDVVLTDAEVAALAGK